MNKYITKALLFAVFFMSFFNAAMADTRDTSDRVFIDQKCASYLLTTDLIHSLKTEEVKDLVVQKLLSQIAEMPDEVVLSQLPIMLEIKSFLKVDPVYHAFAQVLIQEESKSRKTLARDFIRLFAETTPVEEKLRILAMVRQWMLAFLGEESTASYNKNSSVLPPFIYSIKKMSLELKMNPSAVEDFVRNWRYSFMYHPEATLLTLYLAVLSDKHHFGLHVKKAFPRKSFFFFGKQALLFNVPQP
jgi:hypothetical protein